MLRVTVPVCDYMKDFSIRFTSDAVIVSFEPAGSDGSTFVSILQKAFSDAKVAQTKAPGFLQLHPSVEIVVTGNRPGIDEFTRVLDLLKRHITIRDGLDESHALSPHQLPPASDNDEWKRTRLGDLVYRAKDYTRRRPVDNAEAANVLVSELEAFVRWHPRYRAADVIVSAPSSTRGRTSDLPLYLRDRLASSLNKRIERAERITAIPPQKDREDSPNEGIARNSQQNSMIVRALLRGSKCILLDDLYESGGTLLELGRACRQAGAVEVIGITVTKTAKYTQGMDIAEWPWG